MLNVECCGGCFFQVLRDCSYEKNRYSKDDIYVLRHLCSIFGLPEHIVSDNGPQFISEEFKLYLQKNDIQHTKTPPGTQQPTV